MIKSREEMPHRPIEIDLRGPEGNVFYLMGYAKRLAKQLYDKIEEEMMYEQILSNAMRELYDENFECSENMGEFITNQMMESDYENAIQVFDKYFGAVVTLYR
jgi:hypothetical protein